MHQILGTIINGLVSIRVIRRINYLRKKLLNEVELSANTMFMFISIHRWMGIRMDLASLLFIITVGVFAFAFKSQVEEIAFTLQIVLDLIFFLSITIRFYGEFENYTTSSQKVYDYTQLPAEDLLVKKSDKQLENWPSKGKVEFQNCTMRYRKNLEPALRSMSISVEAGMKVGIVGRTGAGKSTILQTLFRLVELEEGRILIDGQDIRQVGLHKVRTNIGFIPQTPFLMRGTVRENLDPFENYTDEQVNSVLKQTQLYDYVQSLEGGLKATVTEQLFSAGQK